MIELVLGKPEIRKESSRNPIVGRTYTTVLKFWSSILLYSRALDNVPSAQDDSTQYR
jgi:hypothetical protein